MHKLHKWRAPDSTCQESLSVWREQADKRQPREWAHTQTKCDFHLGPFRGGLVQTNELVQKRIAIPNTERNEKRTRHGRKKVSKWRHGAKLVQRVYAGGKEEMGTRVIQLQAANIQWELCEGHCFGRFTAASTACSLCLFSVLPTASLGKALV